LIDASMRGKVRASPLTGKNAMHIHRHALILSATLSALSAAAPCQSALAAEPELARLPRHALVIGNSRYPVGELINPRHDAQAIAERLRLAGFSVDLQLDTDRRGLQDAIRQWSERLRRDRGVGVFYYAGHGVQLNWRNFLVPVDAKIRGKEDIQAEAVDLGTLIDGIGRARNALNIVILDACRNNPFGADFRVDDKGLSQLDAPVGTLLAFATAPGNTAEDGDGSHGLYTDHLLKEMQVPGAAVEEVFKRVRLSVRRGSQGAQIPWESTSLENEFSFLPGPAGRDAGKAEKEFAADLAAWQQLRVDGSVEQLEAFIRQRPQGKFAELAQFRLDQRLAAQGERPVRPIQPLPARQAEVCVPGGIAPHTGSPVPFQPGERYGYRRLDLLTATEKDRFALTVRRIDGDEVFFDDGQTVTDRFGNNVRAPDGRQWTPYQFFIDDYQVGKRWQAQFVVTRADGRRTSSTFDLRVVDRERITLPAGTFDAFRIEARGTNLGDGSTLEQTAWVAPDKMRRFLALETVIRQGGKAVSGERIELVEHRAAAGAAPAATTWRSTY